MENLQNVGIGEWEWEWEWDACVACVDETIDEGQHTLKSLLGCSLMFAGS
jgi:hypothetical protein